MHRHRFEIYTLVSEIHENVDLVLGIPKHKEQKLIKVKAPFLDEISGLAIIKIPDGSTDSTMLIKLKFTCNAAILDIVNNGMETKIFIPEEMLGIVDLRSLGYHNIKQG